MLQFGVVFCYFARLLQIEVTPLKTFKQTLKRTPQRVIEDAAGEYFREILLQRYEVYRRGGMNAIAPYARKEGRDSKPSLELRQAANANTILSHYFPALGKAWLD
jgi:hypothetical protein